MSCTPLSLGTGEYVLWPTGWPLERTPHNWKGWNSMDFRILMLRQGGKVESRPMYTKVSVLYTPINRHIFRKWARRVLPWFETHQISFSWLRYTTSYSYLFIYIPVTVEVSWFLWKMDSKRFDVVCYQYPIIQHPVSSFTNLCTDGQ